MKYNEQGLGKAFKSGVRHGVWLLFGAEVYLVERWAKALMGETGGDPFNAQRLDGKKPDLDALWDAVQAMPLFAEEKKVLLDGLESAALNADALKAFGGLLEDIPETTTLIITAKEPGFAASAAGKKLIALAERYGAAAELGVRTAKELAQFLVSEASVRGCELSDRLADYIVRICPSEMRVLQNELDKVCAYAGGGKITKEQIDAVAVPKIEARAFDLQKHILAGDAGAALRLLEGLFQLREEPIAILGALSTGFCDLYRARCVRDSGGSKETMMRDFGCKSEYRARRAFELCGRMSLPQLRGAVCEICECDRLMKSTGVDTRLRLEQLTVSLIGLCGAKR